MARLRWGVWDRSGTSVLVTADALEAFRVEDEWRARGVDCVVVLGYDGEMWKPVEAGSLVRPGPAPPPQATGWVEALRRVGRNRLAFARRRHSSAKWWPW